MAGTSEFRALIAASMIAAAETQTHAHSAKSAGLALDRIHLPDRHPFAELLVFVPNAGVSPCLRFNRVNLAAVRHGQRRQSPWQTHLRLFRMEQFR